MCGIAGFTGDLRGGGTDEERNAVLGAMCARIVHRGPDDEGRFVVPGIAMGMRRLSIIDVAGGHQPIHNEDGTVSVVFNGEIYNHGELQVRLERDGHRFATRSDTETLVHLYEEHAERMVEHLRGMFAFAIWDARRQRLFLARDRVGIKPLYVWHAPQGPAFASELRAFLAHPEFSARVNDEAVAWYLALGYVPDPLCAFEGVEKLPPGHWMSWQPGQAARVERYWRPDRAEISGIDEREAVEELRRLLDDAVRCHLESEVPLGAFLSGGLDSSTVVALMARHASGRVRTFSIGFGESEFNEAPDAAHVASELGTDHTELVVGPEADDLIEQVVLGFDEPFSDSSALPTFLVSRLARQHVTVALSGDGGDELFGGYARYLQALRAPAPLGRGLRQLARTLALRLPHSARGRAWLLTQGRTARGRFATTVAQPLGIEEGGIARPEIARLLPAPDAILDPWFDEITPRDFATQMMLVDTTSYLPGDILTKVDRMSMAVSLEARVPLLDHHVVEFAVSLPAALKIRNGAGKWVVRRAIEGLVPPRVLAKQKQGFAVPLNHWFRGPLRHRLEAMLCTDAPVHRYADHVAVTRVVREHLAHRRDHRGMIWRLVVLDLWLRTHEAHSHTTRQPLISPLGG